MKILVLASVAIFYHFLLPMYMYHYWGQFLTPSCYNQRKIHYDMYIWGVSPLFNIVMSWADMKHHWSLFTMQNTEVDKSSGMVQLMGGSIEELGANMMGIDDGVRHSFHSWISPLCFRTHVIENSVTAWPLHGGAMFLRHWLHQMENSSAFALCGQCQLTLGQTSAVCSPSP